MMALSLASAMWPFRWRSVAVSCGSSSSPEAGEVQASSSSAAKASQSVKVRKSTRRFCVSSRCRHRKEMCTYLVRGWG